MIRRFHDAMAMARSLRYALHRRELAMSHGDVLELVAEQLGYKNWQVMSTRMETKSEAEPAKAPAKRAAKARLRLEPAIPILRIFAIDKAKEFYLDYLGFSLDWQSDEPPIYARISRGGASLHLSEHHGDGTPGTIIFIAMRGIDRFHAELTAKDYPYLNPGIEDLPWGRVLEAVDPFGNHLRFCEPKPAA